MTRDGHHIKIGDKVRLRSGSPIMTVIGGNSLGHPWCEWEDIDGLVQDETYVVESLEFIERDQSFQRGDKVRLKSGGPEMDVIGFGPQPDMVWCRWVPLNRLGKVMESQDRIEEAYFYPDALEKEQP